MIYYTHGSEVEIEVGVSKDMKTYAKQYKTNSIIWDFDGVLFQENIFTYS